jgi:hypothetical protein
MEMPFWFIRRDDNTGRLNQVFGRCNFLVPRRITVQKQIKASVLKMPLLLPTMVTVKE